MKEWTSRMDAIILAGGKGTRMGMEKPKILVPANGKTILDWQLEHISPHAEKTVLAIGYFAGEVIEYAKKNYPNESIHFSIEESPLGTGGAIKKALEKTTSEWVLICNGDDLTGISITDCQKITQNTIFVSHPRLPFGLVNEKNGFAVFEEKPILKEWVSCGWYVLNRAELLEKLPQKGSIEYDTFPKMKLRVHKHEGFWQPLNSPKDIEEFEKRMKERK